jgi:6-phosphogluconolactonase
MYIICTLHTCNLKNFTMHCLKFLIASILVLWGHLVLGQENPRLLIGTYTNDGSYGIYVASFDVKAGTIALVDSISAVNPSFLCVAPNGRNIYAVSETGNGKPGGVYAFDYNADSGHLKLMNAQSSGGEYPCYISMDAMGRYVAVANYGGGSLALLPVDRMGALKPAVQVIQRNGTGPVANRQEKSHVHQAIFSPQNGFIAICDLGADALVTYPFNSRKPLVLDSLRAKIKTVSPGAGPRLMAFHPQKPWVYVVEELSGKVSVYRVKKRTFKPIQTVGLDTLSKVPGSAHILISPDGRFVYASNRGEANNIVGYRIDDKTGKLTKIGTWPSLGIAPRNFTLHPSGKWLLVANQQTGNIVAFIRNEATGELIKANNSFRLASPVCLVWAP